MSRSARFDRRSWIPRRSHPISTSTPDHDPAAPGRIPALPLLTAAVGLAAVGVTLHSLTIDRTPTAAAGSWNLQALTPLWAAWLLAWVALTALLCRVGRESTARKSMAYHVGATALIIIVAAIVRTLVLVGHDPALSDDIYRYIIDGQALSRGVNPYLESPRERLETIEHGAAPRWPSEPATLERVNHPHLATVYFPVSQWSFAAIALLTGEAAGHPDSAARRFRAAMVAAELALMLLIAIALVLRQGSPWLLTAFAWHPLALIEIAGSGHQDVLGIALLVLAILLSEVLPRRIWPWSIAVALGTLVKPMMLPVALFLLRDRRWRDWLVSATVGALVIALLTLPLVLAHDGAALANLRATAATVAMKWAHFGGIYEALIMVAEGLLPHWSGESHERFARAVGSGAVAIIVIGLLLAPGRIATKAMTLLLAMVLFSPAAHPWYLLWALALLPISAAESSPPSMDPSWARAARAGVWTLSLTMAMSYAVLGDVIHWTMPRSMLVAAYAPVFIVMALAAARGWIGDQRGGSRRGATTG